MFRYLQLHWAGAFVFFFIYVLVMLFAKVPTYSYIHGGTNVTVHCDTSGDLTPGSSSCLIPTNPFSACNAARATDVWLMGYRVCGLIVPDLRFLGGNICTNTQNTGVVHRVRLVHHRDVR